MAITKQKYRIPRRQKTNPNQGKLEDLRLRVEELSKAVKELEGKQNQEGETTCKRKVDDKANPDTKAMKVGSSEKGITNEELNELKKRLDYNFSHATKREDMRRKIVAELIKMQREYKFWLAKLEGKGPITQPNSQTGNYTAGG